MKEHKGKTTAVRILSSQADALNEVRKLWPEMTRDGMVKEAVKDYITNVVPVLKAKARKSAAAPVASKLLVPGGPNLDWQDKDAHTQTPEPW